MPNRTPRVSHRELIRFLESNGYIQSKRRGKGSHAYLVCTETQSVATVPTTSNPVRIGTMRSFLRHAGLTVEQLAEFLRN